MRSDISEIGARGVPLTIKILDDATEKPIANALVRILYFSGDELAQGQAEGRTGGDGLVVLNPELWWTRDLRSGRESGGVRFWDKAIEIKADQYGALKEELRKFIGDGMDLHDPPPPMITIRMKREQQAI